MSTEVSTLDDSKLIDVLSNSLYPGASRQSVGLVIDYCRAAGLDVMQKPVHIVPIWDSKAGMMRDVIMPGIGLYRTQASRTGQFAGMSEPEFGPMVDEKIDGFPITYPEWCKVTVKRALESGIIAEFTAVEFWKENYAARGGKEKSIAPNAMWSKRPRGQLAKCATAQAMRTAFPELGAANTAEEMEGRSLMEREIGPYSANAECAEHIALIEACASMDELQAAFTKAYKALTSPADRKTLTEAKDSKKAALLAASVVATQEAKDGSAQ